MPPVEIMIAVVLAFLVGGTVKGVLGMGLPTVTLALLAATVGVKEGMVVVLVPAFVTNVWQGLAGGRLHGIARRLWSFVLAAGIGIWFAAGITARADNMLLSGILGVLLCVYAVYGMAAPQILVPKRHERWLSPLAGGLGGIALGLTGSFVVPGSAYLQALGFKRDELVQAMGATYVVVVVALAVALGGHGLLPASLGVMSLVALVPALAGMALGQLIRKRLPEPLFRRLFFVGLFAIGIWLALRPLL